MKLWYFRYVKLLNKNFIFTISFNYLHLLIFKGSSRPTALLAKEQIK